MRHHIFIPDYQFQKYFYVSLGNIFYCFCGGPLDVEALGNCPVCRPLNSVLTVQIIRYIKHTHRQLTQMHAIHRTQFTRLSLVRQSTKL